MIEIANLRIGDDVLIRLTEGLDHQLFGSGWRIGVVTDIRSDILQNETLIQLDDGGPRIYAAHVEFVVGFANPVDVAG